MSTSRDVISTILKHDKKVNSYKIALLRAINDMVLSFPDLASQNEDVAVPLHMLADFWIAYYWPFVDQHQPILQGPQSETRQDMAFRAELTELRAAWEAMIGSRSSSA